MIIAIILEESIYLRCMDGTVFHQIYRSSDPSDLQIPRGRICVDNRTGACVDHLPAGFWGYACCFVLMAEILWALFVKAMVNFRKDY